MLPNGAEVIIAFLGAAVAATAAPLNPGYTEDEFRFYLEDTAARALIVPPGGAEAARRAAAPGTIVIEAALERTARCSSPALRRARPGARRASPDGDDVALVLHTSGTTSRPKRVPLRHRNLIASVGNIVAHLRARRRTTSSLCVMPLFHVHGLVASTLSTLRSGGTVVVPPRFNPLGFWPLLDAHRVTWYSAVPTIHQLVLARPRSHGADALRAAALHPLVQLGALARDDGASWRSCSACRCWRPTA